jgi:hypothetical protein
MRFSFFLTLVAAMIIMGCSSSDPVNPTSDLANAESISPIGLLGVFELTIDQDTLAVDMHAKRNMSAIGDSNLVSGLTFFTISPCAGCFKMTDIGIDPVAGTLDLTYNLAHPFAMGSDALPPRATNRKDLNIFDTALVIVPKSGVTALDFTAVDIFAKVVANASGYTTELKNVPDVPDQAMPFVLVIDDSAGSPITSTYNKFEQGTNHDFTVKFSLIPGGDKLVFDMYLTMGYGAAASGKDKPSFLAPKYFNPEYNRKNAWKVLVDVPEDWATADTVTTHPIAVSVYDWQVGAVVSTDWATETTLTKVRAASEVASVSIECGLDVVATVTTPNVGGTGMPDNPLEYSFAFANASAQGPGVYLGLATVTDGRVAPTTVGAFDGTIHVSTLGVITPYVNPGFVTYQIFTYTVI